MFDAATIVTLDTLNEDTPDHAGILCEARLGFLAEALASAPTDRPLLLFQHHPPFDSGLRYMDTIKLANGEAEWDVIARTRKPDYMFMGHLHRPIAGSWRGIPFHIQRALTHQVAFDFEAEGHIPGTHEPPDYALVNLTVATSSSTSARFSMTARPSRFTTPGHSSRSHQVNWSKLRLSAFRISRFDGCDSLGGLAENVAALCRSDNRAHREYRRRRHGPHGTGRRPPPYSREKYRPD